MADVRQLERDVKWWTDEISKLNLQLRNAMRKLEDRQRELTDAIRDEARRAKEEVERHKKAA